jgi:chromosome segregation ATPase
MMTEHPIPTETLTEQDLDELIEALGWRAQFVGDAVASIVARHTERLTSALAEAERERDEARQLLATMDHFAEVAETCERKSNEHAARAQAAVSELAALREGIAGLDARCGKADGELRAIQSDRERSGAMDDARRLAGKREGVALVRDHLRALGDQGSDR